MSDEKHAAPEQDLNAVLDRVEQMLKDGSMELPMVSVHSTTASDLARIATEQEAMGGFQHISTAEAKPTGLKLDPGAAARLHAKPDPKVHIETYGCQMNEHDTEIMHGMLSQMGYKRAKGPEDADVLLFNTCAVRESAVEHAFGRIHQLKPLKYTNPDLVIGVCGCVPQVEGQVDRIKRLFPYLDLIFGTHNLHKLPELIEQARNERETVVDVWEAMAEELPEFAPAQREGDLKAWVTIMYGCDKHCTYCIVPMTRGAERSRPYEAILAEVQ
jgi:tRNA-2-methylthio-N6-dimethylallyladenosine synthase